MGLALGMELTDNLVLELGYTDFGEASGQIYSESGEFGGGVAYQYSEDGEFKITALQVAIVGNYWINDSLAFTLKAGLEKWDAEGSWTFDYQDDLGLTFNDELLADVEDDNNDIFYGVGMLFSITESVSLSIIYDAHDLDTELLDSIEIKQTQAKLIFNL